jgi:hypothetical protein
MGLGFDIKYPLSNALNPWTHLTPVAHLFKKPKPKPDLIFENSNFHRPGPVVDFKKKNLKPGPDYQKQITFPPHTHP